MLIQWSYTVNVKREHKSPSSPQPSVKQAGVSQFADSVIQHKQTEYSGAVAVLILYILLKYTVKFNYEDTD